MNDWQTTIEDIISGKLNLRPHERRAILRQCAFLADCLESSPAARRESEHWRYALESMENPTAEFLREMAGLADECAAGINLILGDVA
jgi:hypothetical protein